MIYKFEEAYNILFKVNKKYGGYEHHPLYVELYKLHSKNMTTLNYSAEHPDSLEFGLAPPNLPPAIVHKVEPAPVPAPSAPVAPAQPQSQPQAPAAVPVTAPASAPAAIAKPAEVPVAVTPVAPAVPVLAQVQTPAPAAAVVVVAVTKVPAETKPASPSLEASNKIVPPPAKVEEETLQRKKLKKCDETFAEYLDSVAKFVNKESYRQVLNFVFLFRECLNHYGDRLSKNRQEPAAFPSLATNGKPDDGKQEEYCLNNNAEQAPEVSNEFVTLYLDELKVSFEHFNAIDLTQNFCSWLFNNGYTCSKLSLIQDNPQ
ncbi:MAG: hypothetical protein P4L10_17745 [Acidobacteriaceae bacterium]|nr:hypothetical protein [Acidobacteriaceae bacterium]